MIVNVIHDPARVDRFEMLKAEIATQNLNVRFWPAIKDPLMRSFVGISKAHKQIIRHAKQEGYEEACVMEDDCYFFAPGAFEFFLLNKPDAFDLYLGNVFFPPTLPGNRVDDFCGLSLYIAHSRFYDRFLAVNEMNHIDRELGKLDAEKYVCLPMVCSQQDGYSDNKRANGSYGKYLVGHPLFKGGNPPQAPPAGSF